LKIIGLEEFEMTLPDEPDEREGLVFSNLLHLTLPKAHFRMVSSGNFACSICPVYMLGNWLL
jgi:hypothetical protein